MPGSQKLTPPSSATEGCDTHTSAVIAATAVAAANQSLRSFNDDDTTILLNMFAPHANNDTSFCIGMIGRKVWL